MRIRLQGRTNRRDFLAASYGASWVMAITIILAIALWFAAQSLHLPAWLAQTVGWFCLLIAFGPWFVLELQASVRRMHDLDHSGWWVVPGLLILPAFILSAYLSLPWIVLLLVNLSAFVTLLPVAYLLLIQPGAATLNRFGEPPEPDGGFFAAFSTPPRKPVPPSERLPSTDEKLGDERAELEAAKKRLASQASLR
jgi:uncharacterized membrane protein YhaH (DUF805 family)